MRYLKDSIAALFAFFITCAFSAPPQDPDKATTLQYVTRISMWVVKGTLIIDAVFLLFFVFCVLRREIEWMRMGTHIWTARQFIILQVSYQHGWLGIFLFSYSSG